MLKFKYMDIKSNEEIKSNKIPNTFFEYRQLLYAVLKAIQNEPTLEIKDATLYKDLMNCPPRYISSFFYDHNIIDKPEGYSVLIARDKDGELLSMGRDRDGQYIEVAMDINSREKYIRFGATEAISGKCYNFYKTFDCYIDYHHSVNGDGNLRRIRTRTVGGWDTTYCDEDGESNIITNVKGMWEDFKNCFK